MASVTLTDLHKTFDGTVEVIRGVDLQVLDGEFMVFVGPSGCGKSTLLRMIAGLETITQGRLLVDGEPANDLPPARRGMAMVFQNYALYPHMTVAENMGFSLKLGGASRAQIREAVGQAAEILHITPLLERKPKALSGGQRQRVAIGRAIVRQPRVFLFDEPLSNLDAGLRVEMRLELGKLHRELGTTMIYVTHDQTEAMTMGDRIAVFDRGALEQVGRPLELYREPVNTFVAGFLGSPRINLLPVTCRTRPDGVLLQAGAASLAWTGAGLPAGPIPPGNLQLGVRPDQFDLLPAGQADAIPALIEAVEQLGDHVLIHAATQSVDGWITVKLAEPGRAWTIGERLGLRPRLESCLLFAESGLRLA